MLRRPWRLTPVQAGFAVVAGLLAAVLTLVVLTHFKLGVVLVVAAVVGLLFVISGNLRASCLCALVLLAPLRLGKGFHFIPHMGGASSFWIDGIDFLLAALLWFQWRDIQCGRRERWQFHGALWLWVGLIGLGLVAVMVPPFRMVALHEVVRMLKLLVLAWVLMNELQRTRQFQLAFVMLMLGVVMNSLLALLQWALKRDFGLEFLGEANRMGTDAINAGTLLTGVSVYRPGGLMGAGNLYAAYLAMLVPMAVAVFLTRVSWRLRALAAVAVLISLPPLVLTLSRAGWIAYATSFLVVLGLGLWHPVSRNVYMVARAAIVCGVATIGLAMSPIILDRIYKSDPNAVDVRLEWLETAQKMILDKPILGIGLNKYVFTQTQYGKETTVDEMNDRYGEFWPVVHSTWVLTWAEQGTVGFALFVGMHLVLLGVGMRNLRLREPFMHALSAGLLAGLCGIMVDGLASFFIRMDQHGRVFWLVVAMLLAVGLWRRRHEQPADAAAPAEAPAGAGGGLLERPAGSGWLPPVANPLRETRRR